MLTSMFEAARKSNIEVKVLLIVSKSTDLSIRQIQNNIAGQASRGIVVEITERARATRPTALGSLFTRVLRLPDHQHRSHHDPFVLQARNASGRRPLSLVGVHTLGRGLGRYVPAFGSVLTLSSHGSLPEVLIAMNVVPSTPRSTAVCTAAPTSFFDHVQSVALIPRGVKREVRLNRPGLAGGDLV